LRAAALPLVIGAGMAVVQMAFRARWGEMGWTVLFIIGGVFACVNAIALLAADRALGGDSPAEQLLERVLRADHVMSIRRGILARVLR
jgi:anaerobic C4-dicarboxylate transporter